jgi:nucleoside phosphorylase/CheY-like chemotaxis protein
MLLRLLAVDDDRTRIEEIRRLCAEACPDSYDITGCETIHDARRALEKSNFDVVVLDLHIPMVSGGRARIDGGVDFLRELHRGTRYQVPQHIIALSRFDDALAFQGDVDLSGVSAWIKYEESGDWRRRLAQKLRFYVSVSKAAEDHPGYEVDLAIVCALEAELAPVLDLPWAWKEEFAALRGDCDEYFHGSSDIAGRKFGVVACAAQQMGMPAAATLATKVIARYRPKYLAMSGVAAGIQGSAEEEMNYGDVLIADLSWDYGSGKIVQEDEGLRLKPDGRYIGLDPDIKKQCVRLRRQKIELSQIKEKWTGEKPRSALRIHIGPLGTGAAVVAAPAVVDQLVGQQRKVIGLEMECYALFYAAKHASIPRPKAFVLKGIMDFANRDKCDKYKSYAAFTSAQVLRALAEMLLQEG